MRTDRIGVWIMIGVLLWGIPTGLILSLVSAFIKPQTFIEMQGFQKGIFIKNFCVLGPLFAVLGVFVGLIMYASAKRHSR